eukprot:3609804-Rhodomonas_salina.1
MAGGREERARERKREHESKRGRERERKRGRKRRERKRGESGRGRGREGGAPDSSALRVSVGHCTARRRRGEVLPASLAMASQNGREEGSAPPATEF